MTNIIRDYKYWQETKKATKAAEGRLGVKLSCMVGKLSLADLGHNYAIEAAFVQSMPDPKIQPAAAKKYIAQFAAKCHSYPCFFILYNPFDHSDNKTYTEKNVTRCINNREDGTIYEAFCGKCPAFKDLVEYQMLKSKLQDAQQQQQAAKQKLLDNFRFWKQK